MITEQDLEAAIAECKGKRNPDATTCIKLAAFYTIKNHMYPERTERVDNGYSYAPAPDTTVRIDSDSDFANAVNGKDESKVWPVMDELMTTLQVIQPRLYNAVMEKLF